MSWSILGFSAPVSESSTLYVLSGTDFSGSQVRIHGTGLTYDAATGYLNGGTITSAELFANGEVVQTIDMAGGLSGATFFNFWTPAASIKAQTASWGVNNGSANAFTPTLITYYLPDGTQVRLEGSGFSDFSNLGTVTAIKRYATDGVTVIGTVSGLPQSLGIVAAAFGGDKGFYHYLDQGNNTVTHVSSSQFLELDGGQGNDTIMGNQPAGVYLPVSYKQAVAGVIVNLGNGTATGGGGSDTLINIHGVIGSTFNDQITGDNGDDFLFGDSGNDTVTGGSGNDLISGGLGNNTINGGTGTNTADYGWTSGGVIVNLSLGGNQGVAVDTVFEGFVDQLTNIQNINGGGGNDRLTGQWQ
jgi:Ca2+-binding RTX toxin-like protein